MKGGVGALVRPTQVLLALAVLAFCVSLVPGVRPRPGFDQLLDGWLQGTAYVLTALLALLRPLTLGADRWFWWLVAVALTCRAAAFVILFSYVRRLDPVPYPSLADAGWLAMSLLLVVALVGLIRARFTNLSAPLVLDGIVAALATGAVGLTLLTVTMSLQTAEGTPRPVVLTNLAYPVLDVLLLVVIVGFLVPVRWQPPRTMVLLTLGVVGFAVLDTVYLYQQAAGTFRPATALSGLSLVATAAIAAAPWLPEKQPVTIRLVWLPGVLLPVLFALCCLGLIVTATVRPLPPAAVAMAAAGVVVAIARTALSFRDVRSHAQALQEARTDDLTGVANRRALNETLARLLHQRGAGTSLALLIIDLDNFKGVNDSLGHHRGDELLIMVSARLQLTLRGEDLLARIGGDEFAVVLDGADHELATQVAERLRATLRQPFDVASRDLVVAASIGIAVYPQDGEDASELLQHADLAMYDAKATRTGHGFFRPEVHRASRERVDRVERLRRAIDDGEMVLHYQPQVSLTTGEVVGVEALVRWQHPERGLLPPAAFLRHAESGGLMRLLTIDVLRQAVRQCSLWRDAGTPTVVAVNLSVTNLLDVEFPDQVSMLLDSHQVPGEALVLELTEDLFMADPARGERVMSALTAVGAAIVVDDYGTGYSSLGYLRDLRHISGLKLDRSFVTNLPENPRSAAIVESTVALSASLGLELVAEGVETVGARDRLAELGCGLAQGYLFSRPVPAEQLQLGPISVAVAQRSRLQT